MSQLSFVICCIEYYSEHTGNPSTDIYKKFEQEGLLDKLYSDYEDLHGMGFEWLMDYFDKYLGGKIK